MCQWLEYHHEEPVTLHSGGRSRWLVRADRIFEHEDLRAAVLQHWIDELLGDLCTPRAPFLFAGVPQGGVCWAKALATISDLPGTHLWCDVNDLGPLMLDNRDVQVILVDDVVTTGASMETPHEIMARLAVVDRTLQLPSWMEDWECPFVAWARIPLPLLESSQ